MVNGMMIGANSQLSHICRSYAKRAFYEIFRKIHPQKRSVLERWKGLNSLTNINNYAIVACMDCVTELRLCMKDYSDLVVWNKAIEFSTCIYSLTSSFPREELYGLSAQIRRSAVSIASNIAEGWSRNTERDYMRFINISLGSLAECKTQLIIAQRVGYIEKQIFDQHAKYLTEIENMLRGLRKYLKNLIIKVENKTS